MPARTRRRRQAAALPLAAALLLAGGAYAGSPPAPVRADQTEEQKAKDAIVASQYLESPVTGISYGASPTEQAQYQQTYSFGQDYLRMIVDEVYFPDGGGADDSLSVTVKTGNKTPLTFEYLISGSANQHVSERGQYLALPALALNVKAPLDITLKRSRTHRGGSRAVGVGQAVLGVLSTVFTGGALSTVSSLTRYADATQKVVGSLEDQSADTDVCHMMVFDEPGGDQMRFLPNRIALFFDPKRGFEVEDAAGKRYAIREKTNFTWGAADSLADGRRRTGLYFDVAEGETASPPGGTPAGGITRRRYYPTGDSAYAVLRFQAYRPYPNAALNPSQIPAVRAHFRAMDGEALDHAITGSASGAADTSLQTLLDEEGKKLYQDLCTLTDAGDLSLTDARAILDSYAAHAAYYDRKPRPYFTRLNRTFFLQSDEAFDQDGAASPHPGGGYDVRFNDAILTPPRNETRTWSWNRGIAITGDGRKFRSLAVTAHAHASGGGGASLRVRLDGATPGPLAEGQTAAGPTVTVAGTGDQILHFTVPRDGQKNAQTYALTLSADGGDSDGASFRLDTLEIAPVYDAPVRNAR